LLLIWLVRRDVQARAQGADEHLGAGWGEQVVQLCGGAAGRDGDTWLGRLEERDALVEGLGREGLDCDAGVEAPGEEGVVDWGWAAEVGEEGGVDVDAAVFGGVDEAGRDEEAEGNGNDEVYGITVWFGHIPTCECVSDMNGQTEPFCKPTQRNFSYHLISSSCRLTWSDDDIDGPDEVGIVLVLVVQSFQRRATKLV
jgi:hypothetical protein